MPTLTPVDHDPFSSSGGNAKLTPVDHDPFAEIPTELEEVVVTGKRRRKSPLDWFGAMGRKVTREVFPTATGAAGAAMGASVGALGGPPGMAVGALLGGMAGGWAGSRAQHGALQMAPKVAGALGQTDAQISSDESAYPVSTAVAGFAPALVSGRALDRAFMRKPVVAASRIVPTPKPTMRETINATRAAADRQGVKLPTTLTSPTGYRASRILPGVLGTHRIDTAELKAPATVGERLDQLSEVYGRPTERGAAGEKVQDAAARWSEKMRVEGGDLLEKAQDAVPDVHIQPTNALKYIDDQLALTEVNPLANRDLVGMLARWKGDLSQDGVRNLQATRDLASSVYRNAVPEGLNAGDVARLRGDFRHALKTDIENGLMDASADNPKAAEALADFRMGNEIWTKRATAQKSTLSKILGRKISEDISDPENMIYIAEQSPEKAMDAVNNFITNDRRGFQTLMNALDPPAKDTVRASVIATLGRNKDGTFNAGEFLNTMHAMPDRTKFLLFGKDNVAAMSDLHTVLKNISKAEPRAHGFGSLAIEMVIPSILGLQQAGGIGMAGGAALGVPAVVAANTVAARFLAEPDSLRWLARLAKASEKGTEAFGTAVDMLGRNANSNASLGPLYDTVQQVRRPPIAQDEQPTDNGTSFAPMDDETIDTEATPTNQSDLHARVEQQETGGLANPDMAVSPKGAEGRMQVMPKTQTDPGFGVTPITENTPKEKARVGHDYLDALLDHYGDQKLALMAYNWGPKNVNDWLASGRKMQIPDETKNYVKTILREDIQ